MSCLICRQSIRMNKRMSTTTTLFAALVALLGLLIGDLALGDAATDTTSSTATASPLVLTASDIPEQSGVLLLTGAVAFSVALAAYSPLFLLVDSPVRLHSSPLHMKRSYRY